MIVSASRRTDIPKFYSEWFMKRVRAGFCTFPNPFNKRQIIEVSLKPEDVDVIVFWTKDPGPLMPHLGELDHMGLRYYFQFTVNGYPRLIEPNVPPIEKVIGTFKKLSEAVSPERVIWRYDPILWSNVTDRNYHEARFREIASALRGRTGRVVISLVDDYRRSGKRLRELSDLGVEVKPRDPNDPDLSQLLSTMAHIAAESGMEIVSCAEEVDLRRFGIKPGSCIDDEYIAKVFGIHVTNRKDPSQRPTCGCVQSKDNGVYGTCRHGCVYCYAGGFGPVPEPHDVNSPSLTGWHCQNNGEASCESTFLEHEGFRAETDCRAGQNGREKQEYEQRPLL